MQIYSSTYQKVLLVSPAPAALHLEKYTVHVVILEPCEHPPQTSMLRTHIHDEVRCACLL